MRVLLVSPHFPPDLGALASRARDLTREWAALGHEVHVLCGLPNHPTGVVPPEYRGRRCVREEVGGVVVHRAWVYATPNAGRVRRSAAYASFAASALLLRGLPRPDVIVATSPQFLAAFAGSLLALRGGVPLVLEIRDLWPRSIWEVGALPRQHPVIRGLELVERWMYERADLIVVVTRSFAAHVRAVSSRSDADIRVVTNGVDLGRYDPGLDGSAARAALGVPPDRLLALYAGTIGMAHGLETAVQAARLAPEVEVVIVGEGARREAVIEAAKGVPNVRVLPARPADAVNELYAACDVALVPLRDLPVFHTVLPSKIFEIWGMARPLVLGVRGEAAELVAEAGGGVVVPPEDPAALAEALRALAADPARRRAMGEAGRRCVEERFDRRALARGYAEILAEAVGRAGRAARRASARA